MNKKENHRRAGDGYLACSDPKCCPAFSPKPQPVHQAEINRQDIRERDDFAAVHPEMVDIAFYQETNAREALANLTAAAEAPTVTREDGAKLSALGFWIGKDGETLEAARTQHTPGPWVAVGVEVHDKAANFDEHGARVGDTPNRIARIEYPYGEVDYRHGATKEANARLIAAAPELADALEEYVLRAEAAMAHPSMAGVAPSPMLVAARAALRKAGRS